MLFGQYFVVFMAIFIQLSFLPIVIYSIKDKDYTDDRRQKGYRIDWVELPTD